MRTIGVIGVMGKNRFLRSVTRAALRISRVAMHLPIALAGPFLSLAALVAGLVQKAALRALKGADRVLTGH